MKPVITPTNLARLLAVCASRWPDKVAVVDGGRRRTWADLDNQVERRARGLAGVGLAAGSRVVVALENSYELVVAAPPITPAPKAPSSRSWWSSATGKLAKLR
ncbi:MAG: AMP-binding protein [Nocardioidaceae bacterium]